MKQTPESISSDCMIGPTGVDEITSIQLSYKNGVVHQAVSSLKNQMVNDFLIYGDNGYIRIQPNFWGSEAVNCGNCRAKTNKAMLFRYQWF